MNLPINQIIQGDCLEVMRSFPADCIDTIITDPPYGIGFMGKEWDTFKPEHIDSVMDRDERPHKGISSQRRSNTAGTYDHSRNAEFQKYFTKWGVEALRVLKPGGTMLIFGGTRTYHRLACGIEDAGFILKDCIMYLYGSGFPKATDISKQLDKQDAVLKRRQRQLRFTEWMRSTGLSATQCSLLMGTESEAGHYFTAGEQPHIATKEHFDKLRPHIKTVVPEWVEELIAERTVESENFKKRENVTKQKADIFGEFTEKQKKTGNHHADGSKSCWDVGADMIKVDVNITLSKTAEAKLWNGWKSHGLKPAYEPILVAMKPNDGTYANNAIKHGVSGLNINEARIPTDEEITNHSRGAESAVSKGKYGDSSAQETHQTDGQKQGRFPANVILDEEAGAMLDEQSGESKSNVRRISETENTKIQNEIYGKGYVRQEGGVFDTGGASRFFYCAKASKKERNAGCGGGGTGTTHDATFGECEKANWKKVNGNHHPTVKPLALMRYLCKLTKTPTGGIVLDPYAGSGTTLVACIKEGREYIGIEREKEYCEIAECRMKEACEGQKGLFE